MTTRIRRLVRLATTGALLALGLLAAPSVSAGNPCFHDFTMPPANSEATTEIKLLPCAFAPTVARVDVGAKVSFVNGPDFTHMVTGANQAWGSRDVEIQPGQTVSYTFDTAGIYPFACILHPGMSGAIVVGDAGAAAGAAGTTDGSTAAGAPAVAAPAAAVVPEPAGTDGRPLAALGLVAAVASGAVAWFAIRRRRLTVAGGLTAPAETSLASDPR